MSRRLNLQAPDSSAPGEIAVSGTLADFGELRAFNQLATELGQDLDALSVSVLERYRQRAAPWMSASETTWAQISELVREGLRIQLRGFRDASLPTSCPDHALAAARLIVALGEPEPILSGYRIAHMVLWAAWFDLVEAAEALDVSRRRELLAHGFDFLFRYADLLSDYIAEAHRRGEVERCGTGEQRRFRAVREFLDGDQLAGALLDYDLDRHHLGLIAWGKDPTAAAATLARELSRPLLAVRPFEGPRSCWAWISGTRPLDTAEQRRLAALRPSEANVALGLEGFGEAGFRSTHRQALRARRFARPEGAAVLRYEDFVVEALTSENDEDARAFVSHELRGIEDDSAMSQRLRETLSAYFAAESNAACAGATLGVHQQTIANRLRAAEQRLGHASISARRVELEVALRLRESLTQAPPTVSS